MRLINKKLNGFTLIELLIVAFIISLLALVVVVNYNRSKIKAKDAQKKGDIELVTSAIELYNSDPTTPNHPPNPLGSISNVCLFGYQEDATNTANCLKEVVETGYLSTLPTSPDGNGYWYYDYTEDTNRFKPEIGYFVGAKVNDYSQNPDFRDAVDTYCKVNLENCRSANAYECAPAPYDNPDKVYYCGHGK